MELSDHVEWWILIMKLFGGLSLFLYGMEKMSAGMEQVAGSKMRSILAAVTRNRVIGLFVGMFVTMIIQSSSATTVLLVSFVQAGLMSFGQSLGVILGASIGTTITAQLVAFKITDFALMIVAIGFMAKIISKNEYFKNFGRVIFGFGLLFFGMKLMSDGMSPLRHYGPFIHVMEGLENPFWGIMFGMVFTALIQSSSAFLGIMIVLAKADLITLSAGIPMIIGTNVGTCVTAILASLRANRDAKRVAIAHVTFKVIGALIVVWWIAPFSEFVAGIGKEWEFGAARQIANAHTIYNVGLALFFLPFTDFFANLILKIFPERKVCQSELSKEIAPTIRHLDDSVIATPSVAIELARIEMVEMSKLVEKMLEFSIIPFLGSDTAKDKKYPQLSIIEGIKVRENKVDFIETHVSKYLVRVSQQELTDKMTNEVFGMISIMNDFESIADIVEKNILPLIVKKRALEFDFSEEGQNELREFHLKVCKQISRIKKAFINHDRDSAKRTISKMERYIDLETEYRLKHLFRLKQARRDTLETHEVHMELMDLFKQINVYAGNIGKTISGMLLVE